MNSASPSFILFLSVWVLLMYYVLECSANKRKMCSIYRKENKSLQRKNKSHQRNDAESAETDDITIENFNKNSTHFLALSMNSETGPNEEEVYGGDMITNELLNKILNSTEEYYGAATMLDELRWPKAKIPYMIDITVSKQMNRIIRAAMEKWSKFTCVSFHIAENLKSPYVHIKHFDKHGCFSQIGMVKPGQILALNNDECNDVQVVMHELGHTMGLLHEHQRGDRDNHILMHYDNIPRKLWKNFHKANVTFQRTPYDYGSIMHYEFWFLTGKKYLMTPRDPVGEAQYRNSEKPSFYDYQIVNNLYKCTESCQTSPLTCHNEGFKTSIALGTCICVCKDNYAGKHCEKVKKNIDCNEKIIKDGEISRIHPYPKYRWCVIWIQAPNENQLVEVRFRDFVDRRCKTRLIIRLNNMLSDDPGIARCGSSLEGKKLVSTTRDMVLIVRTGGTGTLGFKAKIRFIQQKDL